MQVNLQTGTGSAYLNAIRSTAYGCYPVVRPIGFKVGDHSTVVTTSDSVLEDMTTFISNVSHCIFKCTGDRDLIVATCLCNGELRISELLADSPISVENDAIILHSMQEIEVSVVFLNTTGNRMLYDNSDLLEKHGLTGYVAITSRHCIINAFTFHKIDELGDNTEVFEVSIETIDDTNEESVFNHAVKKTQEAIASLEIK